MRSYLSNYMRARLSKLYAIKKEEEEGLLTRNLHGRAAGAGRSIQWQYTSDERVITRNRFDAPQRMLILPGHGLKALINADVFKRIPRPRVIRLQMNPCAFSRLCKGQGTFCNPTA